MRSALAGLVCIGLFCGVALAQNTQQPGQAASGDQQIAASIYACCHKEVELAKFVQSKLQSQEAKQFAEKMIKDHTPDCEKYQRLAGNLATAQQPRAGTQRASGGQVDWVSIHQEIDQQCLESTKKVLSQKQGAELDHCYIGGQVMAHMGLKDALTVLRNHASPQLAQQIDQSLVTVNAHLKEAKQLAEQQKDSPSERVSRKPEGSK